MPSPQMLISTPQGVRQFRIRPWHRWIATLRSLGLDTALAAGRSPDGDRWLALRAATLVGTAFRERATRDWDTAVRRAEHAPLTAPVRAEAILAAGPDIAELVARLRSGRPVTARGMAHANLLLTDGSSPAHHHCPAGALEAAVRACVRELDPSRSDYELSA